MKITIKLYGVLRMNRFKEETREYPEGTTVKGVIEDLAFPGKLLGAVVVNDVHANVEQVLGDGDCLMILPLLDGG
ncbi:MoaD/ThiS family protein [Geoalkalibacter sp.]|uniref:MoaD/ThiS family protein n=1 Tax=Geoalkalibacter sp. TaxID=3041440 RepID=UPI00272E0B3E|nr:MoaD/ThiS family protein [Geoalkalibacter sp.]